jgi:hypothetical protein
MLSCKQVQQQHRKRGHTNWLAKAAASMVQVLLCFPAKGES